MALRTFVTALSTLAFCGLAVAQAAPAASAATPAIDKRQANQDRRIDQGVASGQLTRREARRLENQQHRVDRAEDRAKADGVVTAGERQALRQKQNRASRAIYRQKHDAQKAAQ